VPWRTWVFDPDCWTVAWPATTAGCCGPAETGQAEAAAAAATRHVVVSRRTRRPAGASTPGCGRGAGTGIGRSGMRDCLRPLWRRRVDRTIAALGARHGEGGLGARDDVGELLRVGAGLGDAQADGERRGCIVGPEVEHGLAQPLGDQRRLVEAGVR